jgi:hypothetical protein
MPAMTMRPADAGSGTSDIKPLAAAKAPRRRTVRLGIFFSPLQAAELPLTHYDLQWWNSTVLAGLAYIVLARHLFMNCYLPAVGVAQVSLADNRGLGNVFHGIVAVATADFVAEHLHIRAAQVAH